MTYRMLDSIFVADLPPGADAYLGYADGRWPTAVELRARFPQAHILILAVFPADDAEGLDIENGDATVAQVYDWFLRQQARKVWRPVLYISAGSSQGLLDTMAANGFARSSFRLLSAHYGAGKHICGPGTCGYPQADGTQWTDSAPGEGGSFIDESLLSASFFPAAPKPPPAAAIPEDPVLLKNGAGAVTPFAFPTQATSLRLVCEDTAEVTIEFHRSAPFNVPLTWAGGSQVFVIPGNARCALITRVDDGLGDVSAVTE